MFVFFDMAEIGGKGLLDDVSRKGRLKMRIPFSDDLFPSTFFAHPLSNLTFPCCGNNIKAESAAGSSLPYVFS